MIEICIKKMIKYVWTIKYPKQGELKYEKIPITNGSIAYRNICL